MSRLALRRALTVLFLAGGMLGSQRAQAKPTPEQAKISTYVEIINQWSNYVFDTQATYAGWVADMKTGPTCKELHLKPPGGTGDSAPSTYAHYRAAIAKKPKVAADEAAMEMVGALEDLRVPVNEAGDYYTRKYRDDGCKRGKELHAILVAGWARYEQGDKVVRAFVEKYNDDREAKELVAAEKKYGKKLHYHHQKVVIEAKTLIRFAETQARAEKPDTAGLREKLAPLVQTIADAAALIAKEKGGKNADAIYQGGYEQLFTNAGWFRDAIIELARVLDEGATRKDDRSGDRERAAKNLITAYNGMIEQANKVGYTRSMK